MKRRKASDDLKFTTALNVRCTDAQRRRFDKLAIDQGLSTSTWARMILVRAASESAATENRK